MVTTMGDLKLGLFVKTFKVLVCLFCLYFLVGTMINITKKKFEKLQSELVQTSAVSNNPADKIKQLNCLARNIYWEAASEPFEGKVAVAQVTLNRVESGQFGSDICNTVFQKNVIYQKIICQFSWVCEGSFKLKPVLHKNYAESEEVAKKVLFENFRLPSLTHAMYYHADYVNPGWRREKIAVIGRHIFYK